MKPQIVIMVGPPGSGKSTYAKENFPGYTYINQDSMGKEGHMRQFLHAIEDHQDIVVDRMNFSKAQRDIYLNPANVKDYDTTIVVLHQSSATCLERMLKRVGHETIQDEKSARSAMHTFFTRYERVQDSEADVVVRVWPEGEKRDAVICDLDGTLCDIDHRLKYVQGPGKKDWKNFLNNIAGDEVNEWCRTVVRAISNGSNAQVVYCSGRGSEYRGQTIDWLNKNVLYGYATEYDGSGSWKGTHLYMRERNDHRADTVIKEIILDFEILTRFKPIFAVDDRPSVCRMWRSRNIVTLQCNEKEF